METNEDALQRKQLSRLGWLCVACVLLATAFAELTPYLQQMLGNAGWFLVANGVIAVAICVGILLSFWWAIGSAVKRRPYFFFLCLFLLGFVGNATKGLAVSAAANELMAEFLTLGRTCKVETNICFSFVSATDADKREELASTFYGLCGINLLGNKADGSYSKSPTDRAQSSWVQQQKLGVDTQETNRLLAQLNNSALIVFALNGLIGITVLGVGGWWLGRC